MFKKILNPKTYIFLKKEFQQKKNQKKLLKIMDEHN